jgi:uncharacterized protein YeeX (DUF496 family)
MQMSPSIDLKNRPLEAILLAAVALFLIFIVVQGFRLILRKLGLSKRLNRSDENAILRDINELDGKIHEFEKRVEALEDLATGYYSSLMDVAGFTENLQTLGKYRDRLIQLMVDIETLIDRENFVKLQRVLQYLAGSAVLSGEALGSIVLAEDDVSLNGWEKKTTPMIIECCADLEKVAGEMAKIRMIDPNRKRKPTLLRLQELRDRLLFQS